LNFVAVILVYLIAGDSFYKFPYVIAIDLPFMLLYILALRRRRTEGAIFFIVISYYIYLFGLKQMLGLINVEDITVISSLVRMGLAFPHDTNRFLFIAIVFKILIMFFYSLFKIKKIRTSEHSLGIVPISSFAIVSGFISLVSDNGIVNILFDFCTIFFVSKLIFSFPNKSFKVKTFIIFILGLLLILVTRSRTIIAVLILLFYWQELPREKLKSLRLLVISVLALFALLTYASFRDGGFAYLKQNGFKINEMYGANRMDESEMIFLFGSHQVGLYERGQLPTELQDGFFEKVARSFPGFPWKTEPLANRYMECYFKAQKQAGGGWAFSSIAEWYLFGSWIGIFLFALVSSYVLALFESRSEDEFIKILFIIYSLRFVRTESAVILYYVIVILIFYWVIFRFKIFNSRFPGKYS
jgi:hypothetical protein